MIIKCKYCKYKIGNQCDLHIDRIQNSKCREWSPIPSMEGVLDMQLKALPYMKFVKMFVDGSEKG